MGSVARQVIRGTTWSWAAMGVSACSSFVMSPYIVHHLGNAAYGSWILVNSIVGYFALLDLGIRGTVVKFVAASRASGRHEDATAAVSAALWLRLWAGIGVVVLSAMLSLWGTRIFQLPSDLAMAARWAILVNGATVALSLAFGVFSGVLADVQRYDLTNVVSISQTLLNAAGVYVLLRFRHGIVSMALLQMILACISGSLFMWFSSRAYPELNFNLHFPAKQTIQLVWGYSIYLFVIAIAGQVIYYSDNLIVGAFLPVGIVAMYGIGASLTFYLRELIASASYAFMPLAAEMHAKGNHTQLQHLLVRGTQFVLSIALPVEIGLLLRGPTFIRVWMGQQYAYTSGHVVQVLTIPWIFIAGNYCSGNIIYGLAKHRAVAIWAAAEAVANLILSLILIRKMGMMGVAWGTVVPNIIIHAAIWPIYVSKVLNIAIRTYLMQAWIRPIIAVIPFAIACYIADEYWVVHRVGGFLLQMVALLPVAGLGFSLLFWAEIKQWQEGRQAK